MSFRNERGQTMAEFALVLPLLAILLFGVIQFGIVFNQYLTITDAVREGARKAAVSRHLSNPTGATETAVRNSASSLDQAQLSVSVTPLGGWAPGTDVKVSASYPYSINLLGVVVKTGSVTSDTTERVE
jgi:Flp pilus assembly protein TadG